jgi:hypothetical protein
VVKSGERAALSDLSISFAGGYVRVLAKQEIHISRGNNSPRGWLLLLSRHRRQVVCLPCIFSLAHAALRRYGRQTRAMKPGNERDRL